MRRQYPESESLSIKRLKVAIEKENWELFETGLAKTIAQKEAGQPFTQLDLWQNLILWGESKNVPPSSWEKLLNFVENISDEISETREETGVIEEYKDETISLIEKEVVILYNQNIEKNTLNHIKKHRLNLNNLIHNPVKPNIDHKWTEELSELAAELAEPQEDLKGFISLVQLFKKSGSIITNSCSGNIHKMLVKSNITISYPGIRTENKPSNKSWEFFPLAGSINSFICTKCASRLIKTEYQSKTIVESCNKCKSPMYPDLLCVNDNYPQVIPQLWYNAYERLKNARIWVLVNPPTQTDQIVLKNFILDAASNSEVEEVHIITHKRDSFELWRSKLLSKSTKIEVKENYPSIVALLESYNETNITHK